MAASVVNTVESLKCCWSKIKCLIKMTRGFKKFDNKFNNILFKLLELLAEAYTK